MQLISSYQQQRRVVKISGNFDGQNILPYRAQFDQIYQQTHQQLIIDMSQVQTLDSSGIGMLSYLCKRLLVKNAKLLLVGLHGQPLTLCQQLGIDKILPCYHSIHAIN